MVDEKVLARVYLHAVLPCLAIITGNNNAAQKIAERFNGTISFMVGLSGPRATLTIKDSVLTFVPWKIPRPDITLFFLNDKMVNRLFSGHAPGFVLPIKGFTKINGFLTLIKLLKLMEDILQKDGGNNELKARAMLHIMARAMAVVAVHEKESRTHAQHLKGSAEIAIRGLDTVHVDFTGETASFHPGNAQDPEFSLTFSSGDVFLGVANDTIDVMAAVCLEDMTLKGNLHMGQTIDILLDKIGRYLR
ncbi:MAG TPA: hypothetical protein PKY89_04575 [Deltaproteobacteria bacterium]|nr:hypothetical protein [Deltaproteobacteria bacterium]